MTDTDLVILSLFPEVSNVHGDAQNAAVLAARARWAGHPVREIELPLGGSLGEVLAGATPNVVVIGAGFDEDAPRLREGLLKVSSALADWHAAGRPILAVANGWELLAAEFELSPNEPIAGVGLFPGRAVAAAKPAAGQLIVETDFGSMVGYEYPSRHYIASDGESALGSVSVGDGNGGNSHTEGSRILNAFGTHLRGPVLARNPAFAEALLVLALGARPGGDSESFTTARRAEVGPRESADTFAAAVNSRIRAAS
ncbi:MAG: hypothetical protein LH471_10995 [Salinibacterium sp.]|nr:hypothetical protein [Salinibacterium sp.]